ncbi:MAG: hypothetical protein IAI50_01290 [Candidatus Eremiobacteraeota bacterium]|nr:hypothetical protein [Candidatus Eremiobacteraeota bacterium]
MRPSTASRIPSEASDAVGLIIALLVRYPEIATIVSHPTDGSWTLSFAISGSVDRRAERDTREAVVEHVRALAEFGEEPVGTLELEAESDDEMSFVRLTRDARSFSRDELQMLVTMLADRFGARLVTSPPSEDDAFEDAAAADELVDYAIDALRDPSQQRSLVGFREEKRVLVYFVKSRKKAKARARS